MDGTISQNRMKKAAHWLLIIGGLNWLLVGLLGWDIGELFGGQSSVTYRFNSLAPLDGISSSVCIQQTKTCPELEEKPLD